jgi:GNAT superfamily N-acetyltransferase
MPNLREAWTRDARERLKAPEPSGEWPLNELRWILLRAGLAAQAPNPRLARTLRDAPRDLLRLGLSGPLPLDSRHDVAAFDCGVEALNRRLARAGDEDPGRRRTWVLAAGSRIAAFYVTRPVSAFRAADPAGATIALTLASTLAVDRAWRRPGLARALVGSVLNQAFSGAGEDSPAGVIGFAIDPRVKRFFRHCGARSLGEAIHPEGVLVPRPGAFRSDTRAPLE